MELILLYFIWSARCGTLSGNGDKGHILTSNLLKCGNPYLLFTVTFYKSHCEKNSLANRSHLFHPKKGY